jgi:transmembrane sensor
MPDLQPDHLIIRYLSNEASAIDQEHLFDWVSRSKENQRIFNAYVAAWSKQTNASYTFNIPAALTQLNNRIDLYEGTESKKTIFWNRWNIAAAIVFLIAAAFTLYHTGRKTYDEHVESQLTEFVTTTKRNATTLPDGSKITLNINSSLKYPEVFSAENREVYLIGEAFFEITRDSLRPFLIHTGNVTTRVVGTSFNIHTADNRVIVSVASGTVQVSDGTREAFVRPYEKITYQQNTFSKEFTDLSELAWNDRTLKFDDSSLETVIEKLQEHYEVKILLKNEALKKCTLTGTFTNKPLRAVLEAIEFSLGISVETENDRITLSGKGCQE